MERSLCNEQFSLFVKQQTYNTNIKTETYHLVSQEETNKIQ